MMIVFFPLLNSTLEVFFLPIIIITTTNTLLLLSEWKCVMLTASFRICYKFTQSYQYSTSIIDLDTSHLFIVFD